jgi:hypothetical protein
MTTFPGSPKLLRGGIVVADPLTLTIRRVISLQYNPESVSRTLQAQGAAAGSDRSEALRLTGPAVETIKLDAELDATEQLDKPGDNRAVVEVGLHPQIAVLESLLNPSVSSLLAGNAQAVAGAIEIAPPQAPLTFFVWSAQRIMPMRITDFSVVEDGFDPNLNPIRARIGLGMRVLSVNDLGFAHPGGTAFLGHLQRKESLATRANTPGLETFGIRGIR